MRVLTLRSARVWWNLPSAGGYPGAASWIFCSSREGRSGRKAADVSKGFCWTFLSCEVSLLQFGFCEKKAELSRNLALLTEYHLPKYA